MGYESAVLSRSPENSANSDERSMNSLRIGQCENGDTLESCSGGCNDYELGGSCSENNQASCDKAQDAKMTIECSGGTNRKRTCGGKRLFWNKFNVWTMLY